MISVCMNNIGTIYEPHWNHRSNKEDIEAYNNMQCVYVVIVISVCTGHSDISMYEPHLRQLNLKTLFKLNIFCCGGIS